MVNKLSIKKDLRVVKTAQNIEDAFIQLLFLTSFEKITIQKIAQYAQINRSTFYDHYDDKYDLLDRLIAQVLEPFTHHIESFFSHNINCQHQRIELAYEQISRDKKLICALWKVQDIRYNSYRKMQKIIFNACYKYLDVNKPLTTVTEKRYISHLFAANCLATMQWWFEDGEQTCSLHQLSKTISNTIENGMFKSFKEPLSDAKK